MSVSSVPIIDNGYRRLFTVDPGRIPQGTGKGRGGGAGGLRSLGSVHDEGIVRTEMEKRGQAGRVTLQEGLGVTTDDFRIVTKNTTESKMVKGLREGLR